MEAQPEDISINLQFLKYVKAKLMLSEMEKCGR